MSNVWVVRWETNEIVKIFDRKPTADDLYSILFDDRSDLSKWKVQQNNMSQVKIGNGDRFLSAVEFSITELKSGELIRKKIDFLVSAFDITCSQFAVLVGGSESSIKGVGSCNTYGKRISRVYEATEYLFGIGLSGASVLNVLRNGEVSVNVANVEETSLPLIEYINEWPEDPFWKNCVSMAWQNYKAWRDQIEQGGR